MEKIEVYAISDEPISNWKSQLNDFLADLRRDTILVSLFGFFILIVILMTITGSYRDSGQTIFLSVFLLLAIICIAFAASAFFWIGALIIVLTSFGMVLYTVSLPGFEQAIYLLIIPIGLATLLISRLAGLILSLLVTASLLFFPTEIFQISPMLKLFSLVGVWSVLGLLSLILRVLSSSMQFVWTGYQHGLSLVEESRKYQVQLHQTLEDLVDANSQLTRLNGLAHDLRLVAEKERLTKERFVANVSHELRTPLHMIIGFCEMLTHSPQLYGHDFPQAILSDLSVILRNSQHLESLIDDVLDLSQIEAGHMALTRERVRLSTVVHTAVVAVKPLYESKKLYIQEQIPEGLPELYCDATRIRQVVLNLLSNAGRFTNQGGVTIEAWQERGDVVVKIADTGPGISKEEQTRLFQPFQQANTSIRQKFGGSGLGLSISQSFVELHDGKMWCESVVGEGTIFFFQLPIDPPLYAEANYSSFLISGWDNYQRTRPTQAPVADARPRIIVAETGEVIQNLFKRYSDGIEVVPVKDLALAFEDLKNNPAQAIVVNEAEAGLPELVEQVNNLSYLPQFTPVFQCNVADLDESMKTLDIKRYLVKPVTYEKIIQSVEMIDKEVETILVVDDEPDALRLISRMLNQSAKGYRVLRASNGQEALEILQSTPIDLVFLDLVMPEMDGYRLLEIMETDPALRNIDRVVISATDPHSQSLYSQSLAITCRGGLSAGKLLSCVEAIRKILSPADEQPKVSIDPIIGLTAPG